MAYCTVCGAKLEPNAKFCTACGAKAMFPAAPAPAPETADSSISDVTAAAPAPETAGGAIPDLTPPDPAMTQPEVIIGVYPATGDSQAAAQTTSAPQAAQDPPSAAADSQPGAAFPPPPYAQQTPPAAGDADPQDIQNNRVMAVLAYFGWLLLIPLFARRNSPFARFHCNQGLILGLIELALIALKSILVRHLEVPLGSVFSLLWLAVIVFSVLGIINAVQGRCKELPLIGTLRILK